MEISSLPPQDFTDALQKSSTHKRREPPQQTAKHLGPLVKQSKLCNESSEPSEPSDTYFQYPPAAFWDGLSKIWLEPQALKELDRRNWEFASYQPRIKWEQKLSAVDYLSRASQAEIAQIKAFAQQNRRGGPDLRDLIGYPAPENVFLTMSAWSSSQSNFMPSTNATNIPPKGKRTSAYARNFEQHLIQHGIYIEGYGYTDDYNPPELDNLEQIQSRLMAKRTSLSPSCYPNSAFHEFKIASQQVVSEGMVMSKLLPMICGSADILCAENVLFNKLDPLTDGTIVDAKPDFYDGTLYVVNKKIQEDLGHFIIPSSNIRAPVLPNFFTEVKALEGRPHVAVRQACYNGALGARAMHGMQSYAQDQPTFDNKAYTITTTYYDGHLKIFAVHPTLSTGTSNYHMTCIKSFTITDDPEAFRLGASAYRNAREWAKEQRDNSIAIANDRAAQLDAERSN